MKTRMLKKVSFIEKHMTNFFAFFDKETIEKNKIEIRGLGPHQARSTRGFIRDVPCSLAESDSKYQEISSNPKYVRTVTFGN